MELNEIKKNMPPKFERTTQEQLQFYISFCKEHPELQRGKCSPSNPQLLQNLWADLADTLNAMRGPTRSVGKWKESLTHWKHQLRSRARKLKAQPHMTGGGPPVPDISDFEQQAVETFGSAAVDGMPGVYCTLGYAAESSLTVDVENTTTASPLSPPNTSSNYVEYTCNVLPATTCQDFTQSASVGNASSENNTTASPLPSPNTASNYVEYTCNVLPATTCQDLTQSAAVRNAPSENNIADISSHNFESVVSSPTATGKLTVAKVLNSVMAKVEAREKREEQFMHNIESQNESLSNALVQMSQALGVLSDVMNKLVKKLD